MSVLLINADDLGLDPEVNRSILACLDANLVSDTTLMMNMGAVDDAVHLIQTGGFSNRVGVHLNLTYGPPLTERIRRAPRFCDGEGRFCLKREKRLVSLTRDEKRAVYEELTAQVSRCRELGLPVSHVDAHNHIHEEPAIFPIVVELARTEGVPFVRLLKNTGQATAVNLLYRRVCNAWLKRKGLAASDHFGATDDFRLSGHAIGPDAVVELMVHPGKMEQGQILDVYSGENLSQALAELLSAHERTSYATVGQKKAIRGSMS